MKDVKIMFGNQLVPFEDVYGTEIKVAQAQTLKRYVDPSEANATVFDVRDGVHFFDSSGNLRVGLVVGGGNITPGGSDIVYGEADGVPIDVESSLEFEEENQVDNLGKMYRFTGNIENAEFATLKNALYKLEE